MHREIDCLTLRGMSKLIDRESTTPLVEIREGNAPLILSMPHSGVVIPPSLAANYRPEALALVDTDWHIPRLYEFALELDATIVRACVSRYVIDLNRPPTGESLYPGQATTGLCPTTFFDGRPLYHEGCEPTEESVAERVHDYWQPYHQVLQTQIERLVAQHRHVTLYDCHSIASEVPRLFEGTLPVLNLGTAGGTTCRPEVQQAVADVMEASEFESVVNGRFVGGFITRNYGTHPEYAADVDAIQMEIGQDAYMDRRPTFAYRPDRAERLQQTLRAILQACLGA